MGIWAHVDWLAHRAQELIDNKMVGYHVQYLRYAFHLITLMDCFINLCFTSSISNGCWWKMFNNNSCVGRPRQRRRFDSSTVDTGVESQYVLIYTCSAAAVFFLLLLLFFLFYFHSIKTLYYEQIEWNERVSTMFAYAQMESNFHSNQRQQQPTMVAECRIQICKIISYIGKLLENWAHTSLRTDCFFFFSDSVVSAFGTGKRFMWWQNGFCN